MNVAVLGSNGLLGKALCTALREKKGVHVTPYSLSNGPDQDLRRKEVFCEPYDYCFFLACDTGGNAYLQDPNHQEHILQNNLQIFDNVFQKLQEYSTPFVYVSSQLAGQEFAYGKIKQMGERRTQALHGQIARFWNIYGAQRISPRSSAIPTFIHSALQEGVIYCKTDGLEKRQFVHVDDCASALITMMQHRKLREADVASGEWVAIRDIAQMIGELMGAEVQFGTEHESDYHYREPAHLEFFHYWNQTVSLREGLLRTIALQRFLKQKEPASAEGAFCAGGH